MLNKKMVFFRFSNYKNYNALQHHRLILEHYKYVYWGIWKKEYEKFERSEAEGRWSYHKQFFDEKSPSQEIASEFYLLNINDKFSCKIKGEIITSKEITDDTKIPIYYRENKDKIKYWLKITNIDEKNVWNTILGEEELRLNFASDDVVLFPTPKKELESIEVSSNVILHLSDLHFCDNNLCMFNESNTTNSNRPTLTSSSYSLKSKIEEAVREKANNSIGLIVVSGDFIHAKMHSYNSTKNLEDVGVKDADTAISEEELKIYTKAQNFYIKVLFFLRELCGAFNLDPKRHLLIVPGNHDIQLQAEAENEKLNNTYDYVYKWFQYSLIGEDQLTYIRKYSYSAENHQINLIFSCFNSSDLASVENKDYGFIQTRQFEIFKYFDCNPKEEDLHCSIMHHPIMGPRIIDPVPQKTKMEKYISNPVSVISNRFEVCTKLKEKNTSFILSGHQHMSYTGTYSINDTYTCTSVNMPYLVSGSASLNTRSDGMYYDTKNSFNIYILNNNSQIQGWGCFYECNDTSIEYKELQL